MPQDEGAGTAAAAGAGSGESKVSAPVRFSAAEAVTQAIDAVDTAKGAAETPEKAEAKGKGTEGGKTDQQAAKAKPAADDSKSEEAKEEAAATQQVEVKFYTPEEIDETDIFDLDMKRVPTELRKTIERARAALTKKGQALAAERKARQAEEEQKPKVEQPAKKELSKLERYDRMLDPDTYEEEFDERVEARVKKILDEYQIDPADTREQAQARRFNQAISAASNTIPELKEGSEQFDINVMKAVGLEISKDDDLSKFFQTSSDVSRMQEKLEVVTSRVLLRMAKTVGQKVESEAVKAERDKAKQTKEQLNLEEQKGQKASKAGHKEAPVKPMTTTRDFVEKAIAESESRNTSRSNRFPISGGRV